jgi:hypothetical protein
MVRNIASGSDREITTTSFDAGTTRFTADGEDLLVNDGSGHIRRIDTWSGTERSELPFSGRSLVVSLDGHHMLADGALLNNNREEARFSPRTSGGFLDDGRLLAANDGMLYLVSGFEDAVKPAVMPPDKMERLRVLRTWRASGLISGDDYVSAREKELK